MGLNNKRVLTKFKFNFIITSFILFLLIIICWSITVEAETVDINVTNEEINTTPGSFETVVFSVQNIKKKRLKLKTSLQMAEDWMTVSKLPSFNLEPGEITNIPITFQTSLYSRADKPYNVTFRVLKKDGIVVSKKSITVNLKKIQKVTITSSGSKKTAPPDRQIDFPLVIKNQGNIKDTYTLAIQTKLNYIIEKKEIMLVPGERKSLQANIKVPKNAKEGDKYNLTVSVRSNTNQAINDIIKTEITVSPRSVYPGTLYEYLSGKIKANKKNVKLNIGGDLHLPKGVIIRTYFNKNFLNNKFKYRLGLHTNNTGIDVGDLSVKLNKTTPGYSFNGLRSYYHSNNNKAKLFWANDNYYGAKLISDNSKIPLTMSLVSAPDIDPDQDQILSGKLFNSNVSVPFGNKYSLGMDLTLTETPLNKSLNKSISSGMKYSLNLQYKNKISKLIRDIRLKYNYTSSGFMTQKNKSHAYNFYWKVKPFSNNVFSLNINRDVNFPGQLIDDKYLLRSRLKKNHFDLDFKYLVENNRSDDFNESLWKLSLIKPKKNNPFFFISEKKEMDNEQLPVKKTTKIGLDIDKKYSILNLKTKINYVNTQFLQRNSNYNYIITGLNLNRRNKNFFGSLYWQAKYYNPERIDIYKSLNLNYHYRRKISKDIFYNLNLGATFSDGVKDNYYGNLNFSYSLKEDINCNLYLSFSSSKKLELSYSFSKEFNFPIPWVKSRGKPTGKVYFDKNNNGIFDKDETGIEGIKLKLDKYHLVSGPDEGSFTFPSLNPGQYEIEIDLNSLPADFKLAHAFPRSIKIKRGELKKIDIPLVRAASIKGKVVKILYQNAQFTDDRIPLEGIKVLLYRKDQLVESFFTLKDGTYLFENLKPGFYQIKLVKDWLPKGLKPEKGYSRKIKLGFGKINSSKNFLLKKQERKIIKTFFN
jgi:hypothetical protein